MQDHNWYDDIELAEQFFKVIQSQLEENNSFGEIRNLEDKEVEDGRTNFRRNNI